MVPGVAVVTLPWTAYLMVPALLWVAGFMLLNRRRHKQRAPEPGEPLGRGVESSLAQVEHQIWLQRNVFWWYLLPPGLAILAFFGQVAGCAGGADGGRFSLSREWSRWKHCCLAAFTG